MKIISFSQLWSLLISQKLEKCNPYKTLLSVTKTLIINRTTKTTGLSFLKETFYKYGTIPTTFTNHVQICKLPLPLHHCQICHLPSSSSSFYIYINLKSLCLPLLRLKKRHPLNEYSSWLLGWLLPKLCLKEPITRHIILSL